MTLLSLPPYSSASCTQVRLILKRLSIVCRQQDSFISSSTEDLPNSPLSNSYATHKYKYWGFSGADTWIRNCSSHLPFYSTLLKFSPKQMHQFTIHQQSMTIAPWGLSTSSQTDTAHPITQLFKSPGWCKISNPDLIFIFQLTTTAHHFFQVLADNAFSYVGFSFIVFIICRFSICFQNIFTSQGTSSFTNILFQADVLLLCVLHIPPLSPRRIWFCSNCLVVQKITFIILLCNFVVLSPGILLYQLDNVNISYVLFYIFCFHYFPHCSKKSNNNLTKAT